MTEREINNLARRLYEAECCDDNFSWNSQGADIKYSYRRKAKERLKEREASKE